MDRATWLVPEEVKMSTHYCLIWLNQRSHACVTHPLVTLQPQDVSIFTRRETAQVGRVRATQKSLKQLLAILRDLHTEFLRSIIPVDFFLKGANGFGCDLEISVKFKIGIITLALYCSIEEVVE